MAKVLMTAQSVLGNVEDKSFRHSTMWANVSIKFITTDITSLINKENPLTGYQKNKLYTIKYYFYKAKRNEHM